jgi:peptide/nickel transport system permease protein
MAMGVAGRGADWLKGSLLPALRDRLRPRVREFTRGAHYFRKSPIALVGLAIIVTFIAMAIFAPVLAPPAPGQKDPYEMEYDLGEEWGEPREGHPFGQTRLGMDVYYGVIWGSRLSMTIALEVVIAGVLIGALLGIVAGYYGGWVDEALMRVTDVIFGIPSLILAMAILVGLGATLESLVIALVVVVWPAYARLTRGVALSVKNNLYVEAARASGTRGPRILIRHIFPNTLSPLMVQSTLDIGTVVLVAAGLSFIGFSFTTPTTAEWGKMVQDGQRHFGSAPEDWWPVFYPGFFIFMFVLGFNMLGDGLRDVFDPRLRR